MGNLFKRSASDQRVQAATVAVDGVGTPGPAQPREVRSNRGRRIMSVVLVFLIILLLVATGFLLWMIRPRGEIATGTAAKGVTWVRSIYGWGDQPNEQLENPAAVAFARNGDVVVPNTGTDAIRAVVFSNAGVYKRMFWGSGEGQLAFPSAIDVAPDGRMYVVQAPRDEVLVISEDGRKTERVLKVQSPTAIDVKSDRMAIGSTAGFVVTDLEGKIILGPIGTRGSGEDQFDTVAGIQLDSENNIYVVDSYNNRISKYTAEGERVWMTKTGIPANNRKNAGGASLPAAGEQSMQLPAGAVFDAAGRLLVVDPLDSSIAAVDAAKGTLIEKWGTDGQADGQFRYPSAIDYDRTRDWIAIADLTNDRVQIVRLPGTGGSQTAAAARLLTGPLRACIFPFILLLLTLVAWAIYSARRRREERRRAAASEAASSPQTAGS